SDLVLGHLTPPLCKLRDSGNGTVLSVETHRWAPSIPLRGIAGARCAVNHGNAMADDKRSRRAKPAASRGGSQATRERQTVLGVGQSARVASRRTGMIHLRIVVPSGDRPRDLRALTHRRPPSRERGMTPQRDREGTVNVAAWTARWPGRLRLTAG